MNIKSLVPFLFQQKEPIASLQRDINKLFHDMWKGNMFPSLLSNESFLLNPTMDVSETETEYDVTVEIPGVEKKDVSIELKDNRLTIKGQKNINREEKNKDYYLAERSSGNFYRSIELSQPVDFVQTQANFNNGVLSIKLPKSKEAQSKTNRIEIK